MPYRARSPEKNREYARTFRAKHPDKANAGARRWRARNPEEARRRDRFYKGIPEPTTPQPDTCDCCNTARGDKRLHVDHDHSSKKFRGWLCSNCNTGIGLLGDDLAGLIRAITYIELSRDV